MKIAVLGLGLMGGEIALRLKGRGHEVTGWNRTQEKALWLSEKGLALAATPADVLAGADFVLLALSDAEAIAETLLGRELRPRLARCTFIQMGTIAPEESRDLAARLKAARALYLEAPVLGSLPEAREGRLIIMAGGEPALFERCAPVLRDLGADPRLIGPVGQAAALKLAMNQLIAGLTATFSLSLGLVRSEGIPVEPFMDLLRSSALYAPTFDKKLGKYLAHDYGRANFPLRHLLKDVRLFRRVAERLEMDTAYVTTIEAACIRGLAQGYADQDYSSLYEAMVRR